LSKNDGNENLDRTIAHHRLKLELSPPWDLNRSDLLSDLASAVHERFRQLGKMEDLEEAIAYNRQALALRPIWSFNHPQSLNNLASALSSRSEQLGRMEDLEDAIAYNRQALALRPPGHPDRSTSLNNLAIALFTRFEQLGKIEDLEDAIAYHRQALALHPPGHPDRSASLDNLAGALHTRFEQLGKIEDLEDAIAYHRQALVLYPPGHPGRSGSLNNLAFALFTGFKHLGKMEDLEDAIVYHRQALALYPPGNPDRSGSLNNLALALFTRFKQLGKIEDLEDAIAYHRQALALYPPGHPDRSRSLNNLALALFTGFKQLGKIEDLEDAIAYNRQALALHSPSHPHHWGSLTNLAYTLSTRFKQLGKMEDLEDAIAYHRQALALYPPGHPDRPGSLNNLALALSTRFNQLGNIEDLEDAMTYHHQALALYPSGHPDRSRSLNNLAGALSIRFKQLGKMEDLEDAIAYHRQALALHPPGHPDRSASLDNLAIALSIRFKQLGKMEDLEDAIAYHRQALALHPPGRPDRSASLDNLAGALSTRFEQLGKMEDLEETVKLCSDAEKTLPSSHPERATTESTLASSILKLCRHSPRSDDTPPMISEAFALFDSAVNHSTSRAHDQFLAALRWVRGARLCQHPSIVLAYSTSLTRLDRCVTVTPTVHSWQKYLAGVPMSLPSDAASSAVEAGNLENAVELLEQGRAILWSKMQGYRHPLDKLRDIDRDLADQFERVSRELEHGAMSPDVQSLALPPAFYDNQIHRHRILSEEWDTAVGRIRQTDGFANFLRAVPFTTLQSAATEGPIIIVNISHYRSDAIILQDPGPPVLVCLPGASPDALHQLSKELSSALTLDCNRSKRIVPILRELWDLVVFPVVHRLDTLGVAEKSRIWWCPTSQLCALPLHAAGPYKSQQRNLPDIYTSSYTLTLSSLIRARSDMVHRLATPKLLVMGQPNDNCKDARLPQVREELRRIHSLSNSVKVLFGEEANGKTLLHWLQQYPWVHFACHGYQADQPFLSYFQLHNDERLTLVDLIKARLSNAELAFLSACYSAAVDIHNTPNEAIHLAAALQFCGFRSVVGTLWAMADIDGPDVAEDFYGYMLREPRGAGDFRDSAMALNHATRAMRKRGIPIDRWINFVHIGA
jgi:tetratricopeptide (TPR) repeat protein/CHAT domain-containing protein